MKPRTYVLVIAAVWMFVGQVGWTYHTASQPDEIISAPGVQTAADTVPTQVLDVVNRGRAARNLRPLSFCDDLVPCLRRTIGTCLSQYTKHCDGDSLLHRAGADTLLPLNFVTCQFFKNDDSFRPLKSAVTLCIGDSTASEFAIAFDSAMVENTQRYCCAVALLRKQPGALDDEAYLASGANSFVVRCPECRTLRVVRFPVSLRGHDGFVECEACRVIHALVVRTPVELPGPGSKQSPRPDTTRYWLPRQILARSASEAAVPLEVRTWGYSEILHQLIERKRIKLRQDRGEQLWQPPAHTWRRGRGDCEDVALLLADCLQAQGITARIVVGVNRDLVRRPGEMHAWVVVRRGAKEYLLDPSDKRTYTGRYQSTGDRYVPWYQFDRTGSWTLPWGSRARFFDDPLWKSVST